VTDINNNGEAVGLYTGRTGGPEQGFLYSHDTYTILDFPGATRTGAYSINDKGQVVGYYIGGDGQQHSFVYSGGTYTTIAGTTATNINDKGQIVGFGTNGGFLASPTAGPNNTPKVSLGVDTFVFASNSIQDTNNLLDAIQHRHSELADMQHAAADAVSAHDAHDTVTLVSAHALHSGDFHLL
jgi:probable HAF family extracellular repeat protein